MARVSRKSVITLLSCCVLAHVAPMTTGTLHAQETAKLHSGDRVRVTVPGPSPTIRIATLLAVRGDSLLLQTAQPLTQFTVANAPPALLETSINHGAAGAAGLMGGAGGFLVGGLVAKLVLNSARSGQRCPDGVCSSSTYFTALGSMVVGTIVGVVVGRGSARERWDAVALPVTIVDEP